MQGNSLWVMTCQAVEVTTLQEKHESIPWAIDPRKFDDASYLSWESFQHSSLASLFVDLHANL